MTDAKAKRAESGQSFFQQHCRPRLSSYSPDIFSTISGNRAPCTSTPSSAVFRSARSVGASSTITAPKFSFRRSNFVVPGIGEMASRCASIHASATCAGVALDLHRFRSGQVLMLSGPLFEGHG
jgi:hypothetical protein